MMVMMVMMVMVMMMIMITRLVSYDNRCQQSQRNMQAGSQEAAPKQILNGTNPQHCNYIARQNKSTMVSTKQIHNPHWQCQNKSTLVSLIITLLVLVFLMMLQISIQFHCCNLHFPCHCRTHISILLLLPCLTSYQQK